MQGTPYANASESLIYTQVCTRVDIAFIINVPSQYITNPKYDLWVVGQKKL